MGWITAGVALFFGYFNYKFQKATNEFNRLSKIPALNVKKEEIEEHNVIYIENKNDYAAKNVYICSFLFADNGDTNEILYDEIQPQIIKDYPIIQSDILKKDFRDNFSESDKKKENYGSSLRKRIQLSFEKNTDLYLIIALRNHFMKGDETLLFIYECTYLNKENILDTLKFKSKHFPIQNQLYKKALKEINNRYNEYRKKYK